MSFPKYPKYKDSGVEWLGEVPEHWDQLPVWLAFELGRGRVISHEQIIDNAGQYPVYSSQTENDGIMGSLDSFDFDGDYLTWTTDGANAGTVFRRSGRFNCTNVCGTLKAKSPHVLLDYCWHALALSTASFVRHDINPKLMNNVMSKIRIPIPSLREQSSIAAFLDRETSKIDALVGEQRRLIELLKEKRQAVISHAVTKGLNPNAPLKPSGIEWLGDVPKHWEIVRLRQLVKPGTTITYGIVQAGPDSEGGIPYIRTSDMAGELLPETGYMRTTTEIDASYSRSRVQPNDLVVAIRASLGKGMLVPDFLDGANLTQGTARICPGETLMPRFLLWAFNSNYCQTSIRIVAKGTTFLEITLDALRRIQLGIPFLSEQANIVAFLDRETGQLDALTSEAARAIELLQERRTALISAAVTGKIDVRDFVESEET